MELVLQWRGIYPGSPLWIVNFLSRCYLGKLSSSWRWECGRLGNMTIEYVAIQIDIAFIFCSHQLPASILGDTVKFASNIMKFTSNFTSWSVQLLDSSLKPVGQWRRMMLIVQFLSTASVPKCKRCLKLPNDSAITGGLDLFIIQNRILEFNIWRGSELTFQTCTCCFPGNICVLLSLVGHYGESEGWDGGIVLVILDEQKSRIQQVLWVDMSLWRVRKNNLESRMMNSLRQCNELGIETRL